MEKMIAFLLSVFGFYAVIKTAIRGTKFNVKPLNCAVCMSFWSGWVIAIVMFPRLHWYEYSVFAFMASGSSWILNRYITGEY